MLDRVLTYTLNIWTDTRAVGTHEPAALPPERDGVRVPENDSRVSLVTAQLMLPPPLYSPPDFGYTGDVGAARI